ncbi:ABC transporter ATP-binding protein [Pseudorhodoferax sp. Leaf267]|uniref:ABC transporter ATP-binding protein n=1 Tax=Pseudorhodoferax sp. Leaf267 TaxID=1736316 RepID=UPI0006FB9C26|nr:ABC transporter ATP-binding protein [Pseudorhodoferax sp. Leaf267]KQP13179.1 ABC transporter ATP-binding protein [Pseudorhodoferax sp. Leaf267]
MNRVSVRCEQLRLAYGPVPVLDGVTLDVEPGEFFALLGPSGSGKTTLLRVIAGFLRHQSGRLFIGGRERTDEPAWARRVGMVFQNYALWPHLDVRDNVAFGLVEAGVPRREVAQRVAQVLDLVGLGSLAHRSPGQLSGGQQQRVALARTLVTEPEVLLLDEPLSNLERSLRVQMRQELLALQRRLGLTTIFVTHDQEEAMTSADRIAVLDQGRLQQVGTPTALYDYPATPFVAGFVGTMNLLACSVRWTRGGAIGLDVPGWGDTVVDSDLVLADGAAAVLAIRPQTVRLDVADAQPDARFVQLPGRVEALEFHGEFVRYRVRVGEQSLAVDRPHHAGLSRFPVSGEVAVGIDPSAVRVYAG